MKHASGATETKDALSAKNITYVVRQTPIVPRTRMDHQQG
jgi:hypothetical protein